jgi:hypothetical protein
MLGVMHKKWRRVLRRGRSRMALKWMRHQFI